jgi:Fe2+ or Zn2+ uptake regulation protein
MSDDDVLVDELANEIREYLAKNPEAADTAEGILQWWIVQQRLLRGIPAVVRAIERLVDEGFLEEVKTADGRSIFRAARRSG